MSGLAPACERSFLHHHQFRLWSDVHLDAQNTLQDFELRIVLSEINSDFGPMRRL